MAEHSEQFRFLKDLFPRAGPELLRLLQGAAENAYLLRSDFYTMRDWLEIAGCAENEEAHAILLLLLVALEEGSLCIEIAEPALLRRLADFVPLAEASAWAKRIEQALDGPGLPPLIGASIQDHRPIIAHRIGSKRYLYFQKHLGAELDFQRDLGQRLARKPALPRVDWPAIVKEIMASQPLRLDAEQQAALETALHHDFAVISGGPGTGKTTIVLTLLRCLIRGGVPADRIALAAPTGRAAQRLTDALRSGLDRLASAADSPDVKLRELSASTLHTLLAYRPSRHLFARHRENPIPADVVIVDEVSMVGLVLMAQLVQALEPSAKLILLGDKDQLPSVEAGAVLAQLVEHQPEAPARDARPRIVLLQTNHRSQGEIRQAAQAINRQDANIVDRLPTLLLPGDHAHDRQAGCFLQEQTLGTAAELRGFLQAWAESAYFRSRLDGKSLAELVEAIEVAGPVDASKLAPLFALLDRYRLLTLVRDSAFGCEEINEFLRLTLRPRLDAGARTGLFAGAPVLITRNDAARGLFNGDVGITLRTPTGLCVAFPRQDGVAVFPAESLPAHELGFALTVHKSQGSEYQNVMLVVPPKGGKRLLTKELIYTAITRAKSLAVICSNKDVLKFAIGRRIVRESGVLVQNNQAPP